MGRRFIRVRLLGAAAGGGLPQWNCACTLCRSARRGEIQTQTQSSVAISGNGSDWFIINASPDLARQIEAFPDLHPQPLPPLLRHSPIAGVLLTNADLDHVLGLFQLREGLRLPVFAARAVQQTLQDSLRLDTILDSFCGLSWQEPPVSSFAPLTNREHKSTGLHFRAIPLAGGPPPFARNQPATGTHSVAYVIQDDHTGKTVVVAPDVGSTNPELLEALQQAQVIFFDGTFWSNDELSSIRPGSRTALEIGHLPISTHSLDLLKELPAKHRIYLHINNTNPILHLDSPERQAVNQAGILVGYDGLEIFL